MFFSISGIELFLKHPFQGPTFVPATGEYHRPLSIFLVLLMGIAVMLSKLEIGLLLGSIPM